MFCFGFDERRPARARLEPNADAASNDNAESDGTRTAPRLVRRPEDPATELFVQLGPVGSFDIGPWSRAPSGSFYSVFFCLRRDSARRMLRG